MGKFIAGIIIAILAASVISVGVSMVITGPRVQKDHKASRAKQEQQDPQEQMEQMEQ